jgi:K+-transporting ATPase ATPase C chain
MLTELKTALRPALALTLLFALLLGIAYPLAITGIGQLLFPHRANGSLIRDAKGQVIGSELIGQSFASDAYFHGRPSAAGKGYDGLASSGSNLGPASLALRDRVKADMATAAQTSPGRIVPLDLVTTSASGLDPDISPEAAFWQVDRVAKARHVAADTVKALVDGLVRRPMLGFIGERHINVLALNRALDRIAPRS